MSKYSIRKMQHDDLEIVLMWRNHPDIRRCMYSQHEIGIDEHRAWFESASKDTRRHLLIFEVDCNPMGFVSFVETLDGKEAEWGFYLNPASPPGIGRHLGETALEYAFDKLNLSKVCGEVVCYNSRSIKFHERLGFEYEKRMSGQYCHNGENHDVLYFGLLKSRWGKE